MNLISSDLQWSQHGSNLKLERDGQEMKNMLNIDPNNVHAKISCFHSFKIKENNHEWSYQHSQ